MSEDLIDLYVDKKATFQFLYQEQGICFLEVYWTSQEHVKDSK